MSYTRSATIAIEAIPWTGVIDDRLRSDWELLIARQQVPPFHYPQWIELAGAAGIIHPWRILVLRQDQYPIGLLLLHKRLPWTAEVCHAFSEDFPMMILAPEAEERIWHTMMPWLLGRDGINLISFSRWRETQRMELFSTIAHAHGVFPYLRRVTPDFWIDLPDSWDAYLANLGKTTRRNIRHQEAQLQRDFGEGNISIEILTETARCVSAVEELITLHRQRWHQQRGSYFDDPRMAAFYRNAVHWAAENGCLAIPVMRMQSRTITLLTIFHLPGQDTAYLHCSARDLDALPSKYSPGIVLLAHSFRWAIARGVKRLALGIGTTYYKSLLGGYECPRFEVFAARSPLQASASVTARSGSADPAQLAVRSAKPPARGANTGFAERITPGPAVFMIQRISCQ